MLEFIEFEGGGGVRDEVQSKGRGGKNILSLEEGMRLCVPHASSLPSFVPSFPSSPILSRIPLLAFLLFTHSLPYLSTYAYTRTFVVSSRWMLFLP